MYLRSTEANRAFLIKYSPDIKARVASNPLSAVDVAQNNPTMAQIVSVYGSGLTDDWLLIQLVHSFGMCGFDFILGEDQSIKYIATKLRNRYSYLRVGEIQLFLSEFESGRFGEFGRTFNSQRFFSALNDFLKIRVDLIEKNEKAKRIAAESSKNYVPCPKELERINKSVELLKRTK